MPPPIWLREPIAERRSVKSSQKRNFSQTCKDESEQMAQNILEELQASLSENAALKMENSSLKSDLAQLCETNENLILMIQKNKETFEKDLNKLQENIKQNEVNLIDGSKKCLIEQKRYIEEIKELKSVKDDLTKVTAEKEKKFLEKLSNVENEMKSLQQKLKVSETQNKEYIQKTSKYKGKLKYAITIINDLNNMLVEVTTRPETRVSITQTDDDSATSKPIQPHETVKPITVTKVCSNVENMLLSDIFFKSTTFYENEMLFLQNESQ